LHQSRGAEFGDAIPYENFQVLRRGEERAVHKIYDVLSLLLKNRGSTVATYCSDVDVQLHEERARVGRLLATVEVLDPKGSFPGMNTRVRGELVINGRIKPSAGRRGRKAL
jgi:hypothetical protein